MRSIRAGPSGSSGASVWSCRRGGRCRASCPRCAMRTSRVRPPIRNELLNRRALSTSAARAARRNLMEAMILRGDVAQLGFKGSPPEVSMYRSLLEQHGFHRRRGDTWRFGPPRTRPPTAVDHDPGVLARLGDRPSAPERSLRPGFAARPSGSRTGRCRSSSSPRCSLGIPAWRSTSVAPSYRRGRRRTPSG